MDFRQTHRRCTSFWTSSFIWLRLPLEALLPSPCAQDPLAFPHVLLKAGTLACISPFHTDPQTTPFRSLKLHVYRSSVHLLFTGSVL